MLGVKSAQAVSIVEVFREVESNSATSAKLRSKGWGANLSEQFTTQNSTARDVNLKLTDTS